MQNFKNTVKKCLLQWIDDDSQAESYHGIKFSNSELVEELWGACQYYDIFKEVANLIENDNNINLRKLNNFIFSFAEPLEVVDDDVYEEHRAEIEAYMDELEEYKASLPKLRES